MTDADIITVYSTNEGRTDEMLKFSFSGLRSGKRQYPALTVSRSTD